MVRIAAVTIVYHPSKTVIENILSYYSAVDELYIMDNSAVRNDFITEKLSNTNICYFHDGNNRGIAERLNHAATLAISKGFNWLLTMDQDSYFDEGAVEQYKKNIEHFEGKEQTAVFGVNYAKPDSEANTFKEVPILITSGSIINLEKIKLLGNFDENLFIDEVDSEYCYRARTHKFKIIECSQIFLHHQLGEILMGRSLKSGKLTPRRLHAPIRMYYMVRNCYYVINKYPQLPKDERKKILNGLLLRIKNNLIYNNKRFQVLKFIITGYLDFKRNNMGKYQA